MEKQDYILMKQKEQLATQEQKLEELTLKIEDVETLLEDVSGAAYDKAVEVVTDKVREQTQLEDMEVIEKYRKSVVSPNAKNSPEVVKIANTLLSRVREKLQQSAEKVLKKVQAVLLKPEVKQAGKEQIKNKARKSIKEKLANWTLIGRTGCAGSVKDGLLQQENRIWNCEASDFLWKPDAFCIVWRWKKRMYLKQ